MTNHTHLLVEAPRGRLRVGVRRLRDAHAWAFNVRRGRCGAVWEPAARPVRVRSDAQLWAVVAYLAVNPVAAAPAAWPWCSHAATVGAVPSPPWLASDRLLELLRGSTGGDPRRRYAQDVADRLAAARA